MTVQRNDGIFQMTQDLQVKPVVVISLTTVYNNRQILQFHWLGKRHLSTNKLLYASWRHCEVMFVKQRLRLAQSAGSFGSSDLVLEKSVQKSVQKGVGVYTSAPNF